MGCGLHAPIFSGRVPLVRAGTSRDLQERGWRVLLLSHPTFDFRIAVASFFIVQSSAASISVIPRLLVVLAAKDDDFFHTNSTRRRGPCGPENSRFGARCRAVGKSCARRASAKPRKASQRAQDEAAHEARTVFGAPAFRRHGLSRILSGDTISLPTLRRERHVDPGCWLRPPIFPHAPTNQSSARARKRAFPRGHK